MTTWVKLLDNFTEHPKTLAVGEDAAWLYVSGLLYCSRQLSDGRIPEKALQRLTAKRNAPTLAAALVREGMWVEVDGGWEVHDYLTVQRSREQVEGIRGAGAERAKRSRERKANAERTDSARSQSVRATEAVSETDAEPSLVPSGDASPAPELPGPLGDKLRAVRLVHSENYPPDGALPCLTAQVADRDAPASPLPPAGPTLNPVENGNGAA